MILHKGFFMIHNLKAEGLSISEIARRLNLDRKTVRKYLRCKIDDVNALRAILTNALRDELTAGRPLLSYQWSSSHKSRARSPRVTGRYSTPLSTA